MSVTVDTSEVTAFAGELAVAAATIGGRVGPVVRESAEGIAADAESRAPKLTGELSAGFYVSGGGLEWTVANDVEHAFYQEFGTSRHGPQPSLFPAASKAEPGLYTDLEEEIGERL